MQPVMCSNGCHIFDRKSGTSTDERTPLELIDPFVLECGCHGLVFCVSIYLNKCRKTHHEWYQQKPVWLHCDTTVVV
jgi:hypothetical protein